MARKARTKDDSKNDAPKFKSEMDKTCAEIDEAHGEGTVMTASKMPELNRFSTGVFILDLAMLGGWQEGVAHMVYGKESAGKTHLLLRAIASFQRKYPDKWVVYVCTEGEGAFDEVWAKLNGVNMDMVKLAYPKVGEQAVDVFIAFMQTLEVGLVVADSVCSFIPKRIIEKSAEEDTQGELARLLSKFNSKILCAWMEERVRGHRVTVMYTNQYRFSIGKFVLGDGKTLPGGRQINHMPNTKLSLASDKTAKKKGDAEEDSSAKTITTYFKIEKQRFFKTITAGEYEVNHSFDHPYLTPGQPDEIAVVLTWAKKYGIVDGGGATWRIATVDGEKFRSMDHMVSFMSDAANEEALDALKRAVIARHRELNRMPPVPPDGYLVSPLKKPKASETKARRRR